MSTVALLRQQLAGTLAPAPARAPDGACLTTGLAALDAALAGGLPRGRLTELVAAPGGGATTLVRHVVAAAIARGLAVAVVDATRTLAPRDWAFADGRAAGKAPGGAPPRGRAARAGRATVADAAPVPAPANLWVVRPPEPARGAWCADVLLRSGAFALVVLDGAPPLSRAVSVRLRALARESDAALVVLGDVSRGATMLGGAVRLRVATARGRTTRTEGRPRSGAGTHDLPARGGAGPAGAPGAGSREPVEVRRLRRFVVTIEKGGVQQTVEVRCAVGVARRLCTHSEVPDRRGVGRTRADGGGGRAGAPAAPAARPARAADGGAGGRGDAGTHGHPGHATGAAPVAPDHWGGGPAGRPAGRKRRCAEPPAFVLPA